MLKFIKKNKIYVAAALLFALLYFYGNNMEFYENESSNKCNSSPPQKIAQAKNPFLDATDDIVLERRDLAQLKNDQLNRFNYDGLDNWPTNPNNGWWSSKVEGDIYTAPSRMVWPD